MLRRIVFALVLLVPLAGAGYWFWHTTNTPASPGPAVAAKGGKGEPGAAGKKGSGGPIPVITQAVTQRDLPVRIAVVGRAEAPQSVQVRSRIDGVILAVRFQPGQPVRKGQVLAELDARQIEAQLRQAQGALARDQASLVKAKADLDRYTDLAAKKFVSPSAVDGFKAAVQTAEATVAFNQAAVDFARVQLDHTIIRSPLDGIAGQILTHPGSIVKGNDSVVVTVNQVQPILVSFPVPETQLPGLRELAAKGPVTVTGQPKDTDAPPLQGRLVFIDNQIDAATGTILLKAQFENRNVAWTPGQFVNVGLVTRVIRDAITAPIEAVQMGPNGNIAFVVRDSKVEVRPVRSFTPAGPWAVLNEDFKPGERLVVDGQLRLSPGATVRDRAADAPGAKGEGKGGDVKRERGEPKDPT